MASKPERGISRGLTSYGDSGFSLFLRKAFIKAMGFSDDALDRPLIGITNTFSDFNPCHGNVPQIIEAVKRGVMQADLGCDIDFMLPPVMNQTAPAFPGFPAHA